MKFEVRFDLEIDEDSNFLESDNHTNTQVILHVIKDLLYELDDVKYSGLEVEYVRGT